MGIMYKEVVSKKRLPVIIAITMLLVVVICISDLIAKTNKGNTYSQLISTLFFVMLLVGTAYYGALKCKVQYKYSIIADQFIIHRLKGTEQNLLQDVELESIQSIQKVKGIRLFWVVITSKCYFCSLFSNNLYYCVYKKNKGFSTFYFEASPNLVEKINTIKEKRLS